MDPLSSFPHHRFIGDKRSQKVYDLDDVRDEVAMEALLEELLRSETFVCFAPDNLPETRNRGDQLCRV